MWGHWSSERLKDLTEVTWQARNKMVSEPKYLEGQSPHPFSFATQHHCTTKGLPRSGRVRHPRSQQRLYSSSHRTTSFPSFKSILGTSLVVQWLRLCTSTAEGHRFNLGLGNWDPTWYAVWPKKKKTHFIYNLIQRSVTFLVKHSPSTVIVWAPTMCSCSEACGVMNASSPPTAGLCSGPSHVAPAPAAKSHWYATEFKITGLAGSAIYT